MSEHFNALSEAQAEALAFLIEELAEAQQAACKILRHGYRSSNPLIANSPTNRTELEKELGDVSEAMLLLDRNGDVSYNSIIEWSKDKRESVKKWMHHQPREVAPAKERG